MRDLTEDEIDRLAAKLWDERMRLINKPIFWVRHQMVRAVVQELKSMGIE